MLSAHDLIKLNEGDLTQRVRSLNPEEINHLLTSWKFWARKEQLPPRSDWVNWLFLGGRGTGKTRSGAEWVKDIAIRCPGCRIALIAPTRADLRDTMLWGVSGLMNLHWDEGTQPRHVPSKRGVFWPNGTIALTFSAEEPDRLRGPNHHFAWCDELASWRYLEEAWDMLNFGLRLEYPGANAPRCYISTTPRPIQVLKNILKDDATEITRSSTYANRANLSAKFFKDIVSKYEGSRLGRQELLGELIDDLEGALWTRAVIEQSRHRGPEPRYEKIIIAVDPASSDKATANECGIMVLGRSEIERHAYLIGDHSTHAMSPAKWGKKVVEAYKTHKAEYVVVEMNLGGGLVKTVLQQIDPMIPIREVQARPGQTKYIRAEPVSMLYEQNRIHHVGMFAKLEDQMCIFTANYQKDNPGLSPDRVDALVWGITELMLDPTYDDTMRWAA